MEVRTECELVLRLHVVSRILTKNELQGVFRFEGERCAVNRMEYQRFGIVVGGVPGRTQQYHTEWSQVFRGHVGVFCKALCQRQSVVAIYTTYQFLRSNFFQELSFDLDANHHEKNRLIFLFQPTKAAKDVPFDLNTFRYDQVKDTGQIPEKIKPHIQAILRGAAVGS